MRAASTEMAFGVRRLLLATAASAACHFPERGSRRQNDTLAMIIYHQRDSEWKTVARSSTFERRGAMPSARLACWRAEGDEETL